MTKRFTLKYTTRILFLSLLFLTFGFTAQGQIYFHDFESGNLNSHPYNGAPAVLAGNLSNSSWTNNTGQWTTFGGSSGDAIVTEQAGNVVITLTFNVANNYQVAVTSFNFWGRRTNTGPQNWSMSINGINVGSGAGITTGGAYVGNTNVSNPVAGLTGMVTVVLTMTGASGNGNFRLDDFELQGSVTQACTPPTILSHSPAMGPENTFVTITGSGFLAGSGTSAVKLSGVNVTSFTVVSDTEITVNIPPQDNLSGLFSVTTNGCEGTGVMYFAVIESTGSSASNLYISELYDAQTGSGGVIELYNGTASPIDLTGYTIRRYGDVGDTTPSYEITLSGIVPAGGIYLIGIGSPIPCGAVTGTDFATGFNDGDKIELVQNGSVIDTVETPNNTGFSMIRNPNAEAPKVVFTSADWGTSNSENCSNVGSHTTTVIPAPTMPVVTIPATCENGQVSFSATLSNPAGFTYQWKVLDASNIWVNVTDTGSYTGSTTNTLTIDPVLLSFDNNQYYCVATSTSNTVVSNADLLEVNPGTTPVTGFSYPTQICSTSTSVFPTPAAGFTTGGSYSVNVSGLTINTTTGEINASTSTPGTYIVTYAITSSGGCNSGGSSPFTVEITSLITPVVGFSYPANICKNSTSVMPILGPGFTPGGTFTSDTGLTINPATGEVNPSTSTAAPHSVIYTVAANPAICLGTNAGPALITFVAEVIPVVGFSYPAQVCANSAPVSPTTAPGFTPGGTFASDPGLIINPTTGEVDIASSTVGPHTITYTVLADPSICQGGNSSSEPLEITGNITPVTGFSYTSPVCTSSAPVFPVTATGFTPGGTYTTNDPGLIINPNTGEINVAASTPGSYVVTYTVNPDPSICRGFGDDAFPVVIQSLSIPVVSFTYPTPVCPNAAPVNPTLAPGFTPGGMFTSDPGLSINPTTGQIDVVASTPGNHLVTYTVLQNNTTCTAGDSDDFNFTIDATVAVTPITGGPSLCMGETLQLANATPGGTWSSSDESIATVDSNGRVTGIAPNFVDIIYTLNNGCATDARIRLAVYAIPQPLLQDRYLCISNVTGVPFNSVRIECGVPNLNHTFVWTLDGNPLPTTTNTHVATELGVYKVTVTNTISGCSNTTSCEVFESSTAEATATVGEDFSQNQTITVNVTGGSGDYLFQLDHGVPQESNVFPFVYQGEYTITVIDKNGCQDLEFTIFALNYPRFFTPNGDGYNDTWGIKGLTDLNAKTYIFDRFGKLVKFLNASGEEWDGTLNGNQLPSTDYWFLLEYKNRDGIDKEFKAHFSMKR